MGTAILSAVINKKLVVPVDVTVSDISAERLEVLRRQYSVNVTPDNRQAVSGADVVVFSIKPQTVPDVLPELKSVIKPSQLVLSIMAGIRLETLVEGLGHKAVVRVMPNTPALVFESMSVWTATAEVTEKQKEITKAVLGAIGREIFVDDEKYLNMVTAASGSGPAYFFLFVEALTEAAVKTGLTKDMAYELVLQTMTGSARLMRESGKEPAELRQMVTSKGGTTAAALDVFEKGNFKGLVAGALQAAYARALELGGGK